MKSYNSLSDFLNKFKWELFWINMFELEQVSQDPCSNSNCTIWQKPVHFKDLIFSHMKDVP